MEYEFPLKQGIGSAATPLVREGMSVKRGQMIAVKPETGPGTNIFSSVNGTVAAVSDDSIFIHEAGTDLHTYEPLKGQNPMELIEEAGIVGLGGAGFPTYIKLGADLKGSGTVIVNAAECEPILSHNIARIEKEPDRLLRGLAIVKELVHAGECVIALKAIHTDTVRILEETLRGKCDTDSVRLHLLPDMYPMGEERALVREVLGRLLRPEELPMEAGAVVINAETVFRIREAVEDKKPLIDKDMTAAGKLKENASVHVLLDVPLGRRVADVLEMAGGAGEEYGELIMGGPFTGRRTTPDAPVVKTTGGIIAAEAFLKGPKKKGLLVCACGADEERLRQIAQSMDSEIVGVEYCKQAHRRGNTCKCENPGHCPGQVEKVMKLKKAGAEALIISSCTDCSNTVMSCAPRLGLTVYHCTDGSLRAVNHKLIRKIKKV